MTRAIKLTGLAVVLLALILVPFLIWGDAIEERLWHVLDGGVPPGAAWALVIGLLSADIVLPLPSSLISVGGGVLLGTFQGTIAIFLGMMISCFVGYGLGQRFGQKMVDWATGNTTRLPGGVGVPMLFLARAVPVLAEATTVVAGAGRMPLGQFVVTCALSNFGIAVFYGYFGSLALEQGSFLLLFAAAIALPLLGYGILFVARRAGVVAGTPGA